VLCRAAVVAVGAGNGGKRHPHRLLLCCRKVVRNQELKQRNRPVLVRFLNAAVVCLRVIKAAVVGLRCTLALALALAPLCGRRSSD
jgi:hypothetical protein